MATTLKGWPQGLLTDNVTDLLSEPTLAQAIEDDVFGAAGVLAAHCCLVYRSVSDGDNSIPDSVSPGTALQFLSELVDTDGYHDTGTNTPRITVPTGLAGYYLFGGNAHWDSVATGTRREVYIDINNSGDRVAASQQIGPVSGFSTVSGPSHSVVGFSHLADGDYIRLSAFQNSGSGLLVKQEGKTPNLWAVRLPFS